MAKTETVRPKPSDVPAARATESKEEDVKRLSFALTPDGKRIDWSKVRESRRTEIERMLADDPKIRGLVGPIGSAPAVQVFNRELTKSILDVVGQLEAAIAIRMYGLSNDDALRICKFTAAEKDAIAPSLENVMNKYGNTMLAKYGDEVALGVLLITMTREKLASAAEFARQQGPRATVHTHEPRSTVKPENDSNV